MKKRTSLGLLRDKLYVKALFAPRIARIRRNTKKRLRSLGHGVELTKEDKRAIRAYWKPYNLRPRFYWYRLFYIRADERTPAYVPDDIYYGKILPKINNILMRRAYTDKCFYERLFPDVLQPETAAKNSHGVYFGAKDRPMSREEAVRAIYDAQPVVIKPAVDSGSGRLLVFCERESASDIDRIVRSFGNNFIAQKIQPQHEVLSAIHSDSLNTVRVISLLYKGEVHILSSLLRMGAGGAKIDNISSGGYACPIREDGTLEREAVNRKSEWVTRHANGTVFADVTVPSYSAICDTVRQLHVRLPHFMMIGWDFAVDPVGNPVFIEFNTSPEPNQISCGPMFGDLTDEVLADLFIHNTFDHANE